MRCVNHLGYTLRSEVQALFYLHDTTYMGGDSVYVLCVLHVLGKVRNGIPSSQKIRCLREG